MKLEWLEAISAVARLRSFSEAAETIPCAQSSVSRYIRSAEDELGVVFFKRSSNSNLVSLTSQGELLLPAVEKVLEDYRSLCSQISSGDHRREQPVRLGLDRRMYSSSCKGNLISLLYLAYPEVKLSFKEVSAENRLEPLLSGKVDAVLIPRPVIAGEAPRPLEWADSVRCESVGQQDLSIAYGEAFAPKKEGISLKEIAPLPVIFHTDIVKQYDPGQENPNRSSLFVKACLDSGFRPKLLLVERDLADVKQTLTVHGKGVFPSTIPSRLRAYPGIRYCPVTDAPYSMQYDLLFRADEHSGAIAKLLEVLRSCFDEPVP